MKFTKSERKFHEQNQFTPPANYYNTQTIQPQVNTGSLAGPSLIKQQPNFGLSHRFANNNTTTPGPGSYQVKTGKTQQIKQSIGISNAKKLRQTSRQSFLRLSDNNAPSIPVQVGKMDEQEQQQALRVSMATDLNKTCLALKKTSSAHTFSKSSKNTTDFTRKTPKVSQLQSISQFRVVRQGNPKNKQQIVQQLRRANARRSQIINMINPQFIPSLQLIETMTKRRTKYVPGPGTYDTCSQQNNSANEPGISFTTERRFSEDKFSSPGPGQYPTLSQRKASISFSKSSRNLFDMKTITDLEHRFYVDPYIQMRQRQQQNSKGQQQRHPFGSHIARFTKLVKQQPLPQESQKNKRAARIQAIVQKRLKKLNTMDKLSTKQSQGLLGLQSMASIFQ